jgi:inner membrane protein
MPTIMTHALVPLAVGYALGPTRVSRVTVIAGMVLAMLPDADVIGFRFGVDYSADWGHRGASHSLLIAAVVAGVATALLRPDRWRSALAFLWLSMALHGLLDTLTNGGLGAALLWPAADARFFAPYTPIRVSPIGAGFFSARGVNVLLSEARWVWLPCLALALVGRMAWRRRDSISGNAQGRTI